MFEFLKKKKKAQRLVRLPDLREPIECDHVIESALVPTSIKQIGDMICINGMATNLFRCRICGEEWEEMVAGGIITNIDSIASSPFDD